MVQDPGIFRTRCYTADSASPGEEFMDANSTVKLIAAILAVVLIAIIILRRKKKKDTDDDF